MLRILLSSLLCLSAYTAETLPFKIVMLYSDGTVDEFYRDFTFKEIQVYITVTPADWRKMENMPLVKYFRIIVNYSPVI